MPHSFAYCRALLLALATIAVSNSPALAHESEWSEVPKSARARLVAGTADQAGTPRPYAFVEIEMAPGWKTYWRNPGDAGGLPPRFDLSKSENLSSATVLFPAPKRMVDRSGNTLGYKDRVLFPVEIVPKDPAKPVVLRVDAQYGICKDVCIPAEAAFDVVLPPGATPLPEAALDALAHVPLPASEAGSSAPRLSRVTADLGGTKPRIVLEAAFTGDGEGADLFLEAPDSLFVPVPVKTGGTGGALTFEVDLTDGADIGALKGRTLTATLVSKAGQSVETFKLE